MLLTAFAIYTNYDRVLQLKLLTLFPNYSQVLTGFENTSTVQKQLDALKGRKSTANVATSELFNAHTPAPEFRGISHWLNTDKPLVMSELRGKVVLIDFWTYTCINCIRMLPFVTSWYDKYKDLGFVVIGVHTPEFAFEKDTDNVLKAIKTYGIHYPVAQDDDYGTWDNFSNQYWPAEYLIDAKGIIRRTHFGEGEYDQMEMAIQALLRENGKIIKDTSLDTTRDQTPHIQLSPETYLGARRMQYYYPGGGLDVGEKTFTLSDSLPEDSFSLGGVWNITDENAVTGKNAVLNYHFSADKVFLVLRPGKNMPEGGAKVTVLLDGKAVDASNAGIDAGNGVITIDTDRLYNLIDLKGKPGSHVLRLEFQDAGVEVFAFTFG
jgi:thiol-disulfide isomerase/thioredoxin